MSAVSPIPFAEFHSEVVTLYKATRAAKTAGKMRSVLDRFSRLEGVSSTAELTPLNVATYATVLIDLGRHPNTVAGSLSYLRTACGYAARRGWADNPFAVWEGFVRWVPCRGPAVHAPEKIGKVLSSLAARSIESEVDGRLHAWAAVLAHTGLRRDEALFLAVDDWDRGAKTLTVRRRLKRPTAARCVPVPAALTKVLSSWLPRRSGPWLFPNTLGEPWSGGACGYRPTDRLIAAGERAKVKGFSPSSLRHSFATACATRWGVLPATLQKLMGHTDIRTTMRYYVHLTMRDLHSAAKSIGYPSR